MNRNFNFDFIRASTIMVIMFSHMSQMTMPHDYVYHFIDVAKYSIDIFFALSGYLVGTLYWREYKKTGTVDLWWFWLRRWSRTFPLYYIILIVAYLVVYFFRQEPFNPVFLIFGQNYMDEIPYFLVSWTLCIEEHFYIFIPLLLSLLLLKKNIKLVMYVGIVLLFVPLISRIFEIQRVGDNPLIPFGYHVTASHLRFDGLIMGVFFAYFSVYNVKIWLPKLRYLLLLSLSAIIISYYIGKENSYIFGYFFVPLFVAATIYSLRNREIKMPSYIVSFYQYTALSSYTLFLAHPLLIHVSLNLLKKARIENEAAKFFFTVFFVFAMCYLFYHFFETKLLDLRDKYVPTYRKSKSMVIAK